MPDYFCHCILAREIYKKLDVEQKQKIDNYYLYLLGAQGGDLFFAYNLHFAKSNLGRRLHTMPPYELFEKLCIKNSAYAAGFATHYAVDCTLHPAVYAFEGQSKRPFAHNAFEASLGIYASNKYNFRRKILPKEKLLGCTFAVYDSVKEIENRITVTGVERCIKRHYAYTRLLYALKNCRVGVHYDFESLAPLLDGAIDFGRKIVGMVIDKNLDPTAFERGFLQR